MTRRQPRVEAVRELTSLSANTFANQGSTRIACHGNRRERRAPSMALARSFLFEDARRSRLAARAAGHHIAKRRAHGGPRAFQLAVRFGFYGRSSSARERRGPRQSALKSRRSVVSTR